MVNPTRIASIDRCHADRLDNGIDADSDRTHAEQRRQMLFQAVRQNLPQCGTDHAAGQHRDTVDNYSDWHRISFFSLSPFSSIFPIFTVEKRPFGKQKKTAQPKLCGFCCIFAYFSTFSQKRMSIAATSARVRVALRVQLAAGLAGNNASRIRHWSAGTA